MKKCKNCSFKGSMESRQQGRFEDGGGLKLQKCGRHYGCCCEANCCCGRKPKKKETYLIVKGS